MSDSEEADTIPPGSDQGSNLVDDLFDLVDLAADTVAEYRGQGPDGRPKELWVRWKQVPGGVELTGCTVARLETPLSEGEHESRYR